jgi:adenosylhomocysteine nucleosidase
VKRGPVIVAAATQPERRVFEKSFAADDSVAGPVFMQTGVAVPNNEDFAARAMNVNPTGLLSAGTAGGLDPKLDPGTILLPTRIRGHNGEFIATDPRWHARVHASLSPYISVNTGDLLEVTEVVLEPAKKIALYEQSKAAGMDMESGALGRIAARIGVPFLILRVVMDTAADRLPASALAGISATGDANRIALLAKLLKRPGNLPAMWLLLRRFRQASRALRSACRLASEQMLNPG